MFSNIISDKKLMMKLTVTALVYVVVAFIFTKLSFFQEPKNDGTKKIDWTKVLLVAIIPAGLVFYLSESYFDKTGKFHFSGVAPKTSNFVNESAMQNESSSTTPVNEE
jgi:hypothetical protein